MVKRKLINQIFCDLAAKPILSTRLTKYSNRLGNPKWELKTASPSTTFIPVTLLLTSYFQFKIYLFSNVTRIVNLDLAVTLEKKKYKNLAPNT